MKKIISVFILIIIFVMVLGFVSCSKQSITNNIEESNNTPSSLPSEIRKETESPQLSPTNTFQASQTPQPTTTFTNTPTYTEFPTLPPEERVNELNHLLETNGNCILPCWWGIRPGKTKWEEVGHYLKELASIYQISKSPDNPENQFLVEMGFEYSMTEKDLYRRFQNYEILDDEIISILISIPDHDSHSLSNFLIDLGPPSEIFIDTNPEYYIDGTHMYVVDLFYLEKGIMATTGPLETSFTEDGMIRSCYFDIPITQYYIWDPALELTHDEVYEFFYFDRNNYPKKRMEAVTDWDVIQFHEVFKVPDQDICIETPRDLWY